MRVLIPPIKDGDLNRGWKKFTSLEIKCRCTHCQGEDQRMPAKADALDTTIQVKEKKKKRGILLAPWWRLQSINKRNCAIFHS